MLQITIFGGDLLLCDWNNGKRNAGKHDYFLIIVLAGFPAGEGEEVKRETRIFFRDSSNE